MFYSGEGQVLNQKYPLLLVVFQEEMLLNQSHVMAKSAVDCFLIIFNLQAHMLLSQ